MGELRPASVTTIRYTLAGFCRVAGDVDPAEVTRRDVEAWLQTVPMAASSARSRLSQLRTFFRWAVEHGAMPAEPTVGVRGPRPPRSVPRSLRGEAVLAALDAAPDRRARLILLLMAQEGLRCGEVAGLQLGDVDPGERLMLVRGKGGHERVLPVSDETWDALEDYLDEHPAAAGPLIRSYRRPGYGMRPNYLSRVVSEWMHAGGIPASGHALRHTCATDMLRSGANVAQVQAALGHASLATTGRYLGWNMGDLRQAMGGRRYAGARRPRRATA